MTPIVRKFWQLRAPAAAILLAVVGVAMPTAAALAQGWWPWSQQEPKPVPREPVYRPPAGAQPPAAPGPGAFPGAPPQARSGQSSICLQLEQRLAQDSQRGTGGRDALPRIEGDLRNAQRSLRAAEAQLERADCYEQFLFTRTLRRSRQCIDLTRQVDTAKQQIGEFDAQRQQILGSSDRSFQDDIIKELARNGCGASYQQEANRRGGSNPFSSLWQDNEETGARGPGNSFGALPFATYRTLCVRLCDGYYFPISFSTLPNHFSRDSDACQSKCAAPVELYYHQNPGGGVEQMISAKSQQPYSSMKTAFRYRKEFVQGCSCKQAEFVPAPAAPDGRKAETESPAKQAVARKP